MRAPLLAVMMLALAPACSEKTPQSAPAESAAHPAVANARVTLSPVAGRPGAAYLEITGGASADRLLSIASPQVATVELHEGGMKDGMMTMAKVNGIDIPAGGTAALAPGGFHAMLFGIDPAVTAGGTLPLTLTFRSGATIETKATVRAAGDAEMAH